MLFLINLPPELIEMIALKLPQNDLLSLMISSSLALDICRSDIIWKELTIHDYFPSSPRFALVIKRWVDTWFQTYVRLSKTNFSDITFGAIDYLLSWKYGSVSFTLPSIEVLKPYIGKSLPFLGGNANRNVFDELDTLFTYYTKLYPDTQLTLNIEHGDAFVLQQSFATLLSSEDEKLFGYEWVISDYITHKLIGMLLTNSIQLRNHRGENMLDYSNGKIYWLER